MVILSFSSAEGVCGYGENEKTKEALFFARLHREFDTANHMILIFFV